MSLIAPAAAAQDRAAVISLTYQGQPPGVPRAEDLTEIKKLGFSAITWPEAQPAGLPALTRFAKEAGLQVIVRGEAGDRDFVDVQPDRIPAGSLTPLVWRAIAHGARVVSIDTLRILNAGRPVSQQLIAAASIAHQLRANAGLFAHVRPGPEVQIDPALSRSVDASLLDAGRSWVLIATNTSATRVRGEAHLPAAIPYAMWLNLLDGSTMAMLEARTGPRWAFDLEPWGVRICVIDKILK